MKKVELLMEKVVCYIQFVFPVTRKTFVIAISWMFYSIDIFVVSFRYCWSSSQFHSSVTIRATLIRSSHILRTYFSSSSLSLSSSLSPLDHASSDEFDRLRNLAGRLDRTDRSIRGVRAHFLPFPLLHISEAKIKI